MSTTTLPTWSMIAADAARHREQIREELRRWGAVLHTRGRHRGFPSRWSAALDATSRPYRSRLAGFDHESTDRDRGEAAADDLWDAVAVAWAFIRWANAEKLDHAPGTEHVFAELQSAGRWLAEYPVAVAGHDAAIAGLFAAAEGGTR